MLQIKKRIVALLLVAGPALGETGVTLRCSDYQSMPFPVQGFWESGPGYRQPETGALIFPDLHCLYGSLDLCGGTTMVVDGSAGLVRHLDADGGLMAEGSWIPSARDAQVINAELHAISAKNPWPVNHLRCRMEGGED